MTRIDTGRILTVILILTTLMVFTHTRAEDPCSNNTIMDIVKNLESLYSSYVNISRAIELTHMLITSCDMGNTNSSASLVDEIYKEINRLRRVSGAKYIEVVSSKIAVGISILSMPFLIYFLLPKIYLYIWFKTRRRWLVVKRK